MAKPSLRESFLDAGLSTMFRLGYAGAGIRDIAAAAEAPQGSFTNHFRSKEAFAGEVLDRYFEYAKGIMDETLGDRTLPPRDRIRRYLDAITERLGAAGWARGCLIGNFSLEVPIHSDFLRARLSAIFAEWREPFAACIAEGQALGDIPTEQSALDLADFLIAGWQGSMLRMKVDRDPAPLERFKSILFNQVLARRPG
jgi:TetR/AcrR family transcriptional repressor of nem operon